MLSNEALEISFHEIAVGYTAYRSLRDKAAALGVTVPDDASDQFIEDYTKAVCSNRSDEQKRAAVHDALDLAFLTAY